MDEEEELAKSLIEAAREAIHEEEAPSAPAPPNETDELDALIRNEAKHVQTAFRTVTDAADRHRLQRQYNELDHWLTVLKAIDAMPDPHEAAEMKRALRGPAMETLRKWHNEDVVQQRVHEEQEAKRRKLLDGGVAMANRRIRNELEMLLNNYTKSNDSKIESLLNRWRRSGDPAYDPGMHQRLANARRKKRGQAH